MKTLFAATASALALFASAFAQETGSYVTLGYTQLSDDENVDLGALTGRYGYDFTRWFALEGEVHYGIVDDTYEFLGEEIDISANFGAGAYAKAQYPLGANGSSLFARIGYATIEIEGEYDGESETENLDGFAYGFGGNFMFSPLNGVRGEYTRFEDDDSEADTYSISFVRRF